MSAAPPPAHPPAYMPPGYVDGQSNEKLSTLFARVRTLVLVTGTNGKSTTAHLVEQILSRARRFPLRNRDGANMMQGITQTLADAFFVSRRPVVLEVDEGCLPFVVPPARPAVFVVTNVFRDHLDRFGEVDAVTAEIARALAATPDDCVLIANADDPAVADLALRAGRRTVFFGLAGHGAPAPGPSADSIVCPRCGAPLRFVSAALSHLGDYSCPRCEFARPAPTVVATNVRIEGVSGASFTLDGLQVRTPLVGIHGVYNTLGALAAARAMNIGDSVSIGALRLAKAMPGRSEWIGHNGRRIFLGLVKNPAGFEAVTRILPAGRGRHILLLLNDRWADGHDISWIWDTDFAIFRDDRVWLGGMRAEALALRLKYARITPASPPIHAHGAAFQDALAGTRRGDALYVFMSYTAMLDLFAVLRKRLVPA